MAVLPRSPDSDAVQLLAMESAVRISLPLVGWVAALFTLVRLAELMTDPVGPRVPWVWTVTASEEKRVAVSAMRTSPVVSVAFWGLLEASGARVTTGVGPTSGWGPPKRVMPNARYP
jgi:hypothetical protein